MTKESYSKSALNVMYRTTKQALEKAANMNLKILVISLFVLHGCVGMPDSVRPVAGFELERYLGKWYEVARLDHSFEKGLSRVTAEYSLREDGGILVLNRGFLASENEWKKAEGKACFVNSDSEGYLKVSFFGPFYGSYVIFELDRDTYEYAFVSGPNTKYLWLLSRTPSVKKEVVEKFIEMAGSRGFDTDGLIFVNHDSPDMILRPEDSRVR